MVEPPPDLLGGSVEGDRPQPRGSGLVPDRKSTGARRRMRKSDQHQYVYDSSKDLAIVQAMKLGASWELALLGPDGRSNCYFDWELRTDGKTLSGLGFRSISPQFSLRNRTSDLP